jgi:fluoride exporter
MNFQNLLVIGLGGMIGSIARYVASKSVDATLGPNFPYGTMTVNIMGSFAIGIIFAVALKKGEISEGWRLFLATGVCGGFTTFSAFALENLIMLQQKPVISIFYVIGTLAGGLAAIALGFYGTRALL